MRKLFIKALQIEALIFIGIFALYLVFLLIAANYESQIYGADFWEIVRFGIGL